MDIVAQFDPSIQPIPNVNANIPHNGKIVFYNESNIGLKLTFSDGVTDILAPWTAQVYCLGAIPSPQIQFNQAYTSASTGSPVSLVIGIRYMPSEKVHGTFPIALARQANIGHAITTMSTSNQVNNDGNPIVTTFVEATQVGNAAGSNVALGNDGSYLFAQYVAAARTVLEQLVPGASPVLKWGAKLVLQAVDNVGANSSSILGVDSSGNTFLQNHKTNNQTVIYDKNGVALLTVDANAQVSIKGSTSVNNGDTSGTQTLYEGFYGIYKMVLVYQNNYRQAGGAFHNALVNNFALGAFWVNAGCGGLGAANWCACLSSYQITLGT